MREIRTPRSVGTGGGRPPPVTRWMCKRSHGRTSEAPPDERGGYRYVRPTATASHLDSTHLARSRGVVANVPSPNRQPPFATGPAPHNRSLLTYSLASRLRASLMEARVTKVAKVSARFPTSFARRWLRLKLRAIVRARSSEGSFPVKWATPRVRSFRLSSGGRRGASSTR